MAADPVSSPNPLTNAVATDPDPSAKTKDKGVDTIKAEGEGVKSVLETLTKGLVAALGVAYGTGFLVVFIFLDRFGVRETGGDFFKLKYIYIGALCMMFPIYFTCFGYGLSKMRVALPQESPANSLPSLWKRFISTPQSFSPPVFKSLPFPSVLVNVILITVSYLIIAFAHPGYYASRQTFITVLNSLIVIQLSLRHIFGKKCQLE